MKHFREIAGAPKPVGAYSAAVVHNGVAYLAGQIALGPEGGSLVEGDVTAQAKQVLSNLKTVLEGVGSSPEKILMTTIFLANISDSKAVNELYGKFVSQENPPARQTLAVKDLPMGALVEISVIAAVS